MYDEEWWGYDDYGSSPSEPENIATEDQHFESVAEWEAAGSPVGTEDVSVTIGKTPEPDEPFKPDFTKEDPYEGVTEEYIEKVQESYVPTEEQPLSPVERAGLVEPEPEPTPVITPEPTMSVSEAKEIAETIGDEEGLGVLTPEQQQAVDVIAEAMKQEPEQKLHFETVEEWKAAGSPVGDEKTSVTISRTPEPDEPFKPDFTKDNPYEGAPADYFYREEEVYKPTEEFPLPPSLRTEEGKAARAAVGVSVEPPEDRFKPDFTKDNPYEGAPPDYFKREEAVYKPTPEQPLPPSMRTDEGFKARTEAGLTMVEGAVVQDDGTQTLTIGPEDNRLDIILNEDLARYAYLYPDTFKVLKEKGIEAFEDAHAKMVEEAIATQTRIDRRDAAIIREQQQQRTEFERQYTELPDGQWIDKAQLEAIKDTEPEMYDIMVSKGYAAGEKWFKDNYTQLPDKQYIKNAQLSSIKQESPDVYRLLTSKGFGDAQKYVQQANVEYQVWAEADKKLEPYKDKEGFIDGAEWLRDNPKGQQILRDAGFTKEAIESWEKYNEFPWARTTAQEKLQKAWKDAGGTFDYSTSPEKMEQILRDNPELLKMPTADKPLAKLEEPDYSLGYFTANFVENRIGEWGDTKENREILKNLAQQEYVRRYGKGTLLASQATDVASALFVPARALHPEVEVKDIKAMEWALGGAQLGLLAIPLVGGTAGKAISAAAGGLFTYETVKNWKDMTPGQRALAVAVDVAILAPFIVSAAKQVKISKVEVPLKSGKVDVVWRGVDIGGNPVIGTSKGNISVGTRNITFPKATEVKGTLQTSTRSGVQGFEPITKLETRILATERNMKKMGFAQSEIDKVKLTLKTRGQIANMRSPWEPVNVQPEAIKTLNERSMSEIIRESSRLGNKIDRIYGSITIKQQLKPKLRGWRKPADIDIQTNMNAIDTEAFAQTLLKRLRTTEGARNVRMKPGTPLIEVKRGGMWHHAVDLHSMDDIAASAAEKSLDSTMGAYGMLHAQKTITVNYPGLGKVNIMRLSESGRRKAQAILRWYGGEIRPEAHRVKDIADYYVILHTFKGEKVANNWAKVFGYNPDDLMNLVKDDPLNIPFWEMATSSAKAKPGSTATARIILPESLSKSLASSSLARSMGLQKAISTPIPSYVALSPKALKTISPSVAVRPSVKVTPSGAVVPSVKVKPSPGAKPRPSPKVTPSGKAPSPKPSPKVSPPPKPSPKPSVPVKPSPKVVPSVSVVPSPTPSPSPYPSPMVRPSPRATPKPSPKPSPAPKPSPPVPSPKPGRRIVLPAEQKIPKTQAAIKDTAVTWYQGKVTRKGKRVEVWWGINAPYKSESNVWLLFERPRGVTVPKGRLTAYNTIQLISKRKKPKSPELITLDMGNQDVIIRKPTKKPGTQGAIEFKRDIGQKTKRQITLGRAKPKLTKAKKRRGTKRKRTTLSLSATR